MTIALPEAKLDTLLARHAALEAELLGQVNSDTYVRITRELSEIAPVVEAVKAYRAASAEIAGLDALIADPATDAEMRAMAEAERPQLEVRRTSLPTTSASRCCRRTPWTNATWCWRSAPAPAATRRRLFAGDLFRMYERFAALQGWKVEVISRAKAPWAASRRSSPRCRAAAPSPN